MQTLLKNKIAWVTGAGRGIGKAIALELSKNGVTVFLSSRSEEEISNVSGMINDSGGISYAFKCDVSNEYDVKNTYSKINETTGKIDILVNNAGVFKPAPILETTLDDWNKTIDINLKGAFLTTKTALPSMITKKSGHIVNIASVAGIEPYANSSVYCASKYGLMGFTAVTREEVREHNIKVTAILPGAVDSSIWDSLDFNLDRKKMLTPKDVADAVIYACKCEKNAMPQDIILRPVSNSL